MWAWRALRGLVVLVFALAGLVALGVLAGVGLGLVVVLVALAAGLAELTRP